MVSSDKKQRVVETGLFMKGGLFLTMDENKQKFEETGDERYVSSHTRLVIRTRLKNKKTSGFLMTVMPSVEYIELTDFNPFDKISYIERDKQFTGRIIYHSLDGESMNGWVYENGKITHSIKPAREVDDPVVMMKSSGSYDCVLIQVWGMTRICTDWYQYDYYGNPVYTGTACTPWIWG